MSAATAGRDGHIDDPPIDDLPIYDRWRLIEAHTSIRTAISRSIFAELCMFALTMALIPPSKGRAAEDWFPKGSGAFSSQRIWPAGMKSFPTSG
jgi:hypothetical protein